MRPTSILTTSVLLAASLGAQGPLPFVIGVDPVGVPGGVPATMLPSATVHQSPRAWPVARQDLSGFARVLPARVSGHWVPDAIILVDGTPLLATAPALHSHVGRLLFDGGSSPVVDAAVLHGRGGYTGNPWHDGIALVGASGLTHYKLAPGKMLQLDDPLSVAVPATYTNTPIGGAEWSQVIMLATGLRDSPAIFGVQADGTVRVATYDTVAGAYVTTDGGWSVSGNPIAIASIDWDADGAEEVAVLTDDGLFVCTQSGVPVYTELVESDAGDLTVYRTHGRENLAWLRNTGTKDIALRGLSLRVDVALDQSVPFVGISAGAVNSPDCDDLCLTDSVHWDVTVLVNLTDVLPLTPFLYDISSAIRVGVAAAADNRAPIACAAALADFDGDGDADILSPLEPGTVNVPPGHILTLVDALYPKKLGLASIAIGSPQEGQVTISFLRDTPDMLETHHEIVMWKVDAAGEMVLDGPATPHAALKHVASGPGTADVTFDYDPAHVANGGEYYVMLRPIVKNGAVVTAAGPAYTRKVDNNDGETEHLPSGPVPPPPSEPPPPPSSEEQEQPSGGG